jgi:hypothetical protein
VCGARLRRRSPRAHASRHAACPQAESGDCASHAAARAKDPPCRQRGGAADEGNSFAASVLPFQGQTNAPRKHSGAAQSASAVSHSKTHKQRRREREREGESGLGAAAASAPAQKTLPPSASPENHKSGTMGRSAHGCGPPPPQHIRAPCCGLPSVCATACVNCHAGAFLTHCCAGGTLRRHGGISKTSYPMRPTRDHLAPSLLCDRLSG